MRLNFYTNKTQNTPLLGTLIFVSLHKQQKLIGDMPVRQKKVLYLLILNCAFLILNCSDEPTQPPPTIMEIRDTIAVAIDQVTHRSISLRLSKTINEKSSYALNRSSGLDTFTFVPFALSQRDTVFIDDNHGEGLTIDNEYSYFAYRIDSTGSPKDTGNAITTRTLAVTSHDFTWTEYTLGSGELRDVWGTDENNVYAVGSVKFGDSTFGVIKWDGNEWKPELFIGGKQTIYGFSEKDIWIGGGSVKHFDGQKWIDIDHKLDNGDRKSVV